MPALAHSVSLKSIAAVLGGGRAFSPLSLFVASEPGGWYDPSDLTTLYQDAAGTTPVTAVEQPVGLVLDKSRGLVLGPELVTNGDFSNGTTGWESGSSNTTLTVVGGEAKSEVTTASSRALLYRPVAFATSNVLYKVEFDVYSPGYSGAIRCSLNDSVADDGFSFTATVTATKTRVTSYLRAGPTPKLYITSTPSALSLGSIVYFDNVSVKQVQGSHLSQSTAAARPVLSARVNLLTRTEELSNAAWINGPISNGTRTNGSVSISNSEGYCYVRQNGTFDAALNYTASFEVTCDQTVSNVPIRVGDAYSLVNVTANVAQRVTLTACKTAAAYVDFGIDARDAIVPGGSNATGYTLTFNRIDLRPANAGVGLPAYQRVGAATAGSSTAAGNADYDTTGFPLYLKFDGTDDFLQSSTITPGSVDKAQVFAGVRKIGTNAYAVVAETGTTGNDVGSWTLCSGASASAYLFASGGTTRRFAETATSFVPPITNVLRGIADIPGDYIGLSVDAGSPTTSILDQGTGNFQPLATYVGARAGTSLRFNGQLYSLILRFSAANLDAATITATETWVNGQTRAF